MAVQRRKLLLMGPAGVGKSSMRSVITGHAIAKDCARLGPTSSVEHSTVRFLGDMVLNLWDCGGQGKYVRDYFERQREQVFSLAALLIFVFDATDDLGGVDESGGAGGGGGSGSGGDELTGMQFFGKCAAFLAEFSPDARIFVLVHKMDLVPPESRARLFADTEALALASAGDMRDRVSTFATSIWDETLYRAWSAIVCELVPNVQVLERQLATFCDACEADEAVLFERASFLVIAHAARRRHGDGQRYEKISNIIKQFKLSVNRQQARFESISVGNSGFSAVIEAFTATTYIMVVTSKPGVYTAGTRLNINVARVHFAALLEG
jgi:Ras-related GTP-binding protein A/B